jgi:3-hydroxyisobutyrate dehydrogenase
LASKTAFLGLGIMGGSMAANLSRAGFAVCGWNRTPDKPTVKSAQAAGVQSANTALEAVKDVDAVFLCLTDAADLKELLLGETGIAGGIARGALVVDMSTTGPACARDLHGQLFKLGLHYLDAPVSGGDVGAREGTLTIMVGGDRSDFDRAQPYFKAMGKNIWYCGESGSGQAVKLCNQVLCAVNMVAVVEAIGLAESLNIDPKFVVDVCQSGAAGSWALSNLGPRILKGDLAPGFKLKDMLKDLRLVGECGPDSDALPGTGLAEKMFVTARSLGGTNGGDQGTQAMIRAYRQRK